MRIILLIILIVSHLMSTGAPMFDASALTQAIATYQKIKEQYDQMKKQTENLTKQLDQATASGLELKKISSGNMGDVKRWKRHWKKTNRQMDKVKRTTIDINNKFNKMFNLQNGDYYEGKYKDKTAKEMTTDIKKLLNSNLKTQHKLSLTSKIRRPSKEQVKVAREKKVKRENSNTKLALSIAENITYNSFIDIMSDKEEENKAIEEELQSYQDTLMHESDLYGMSHLTNRLLINMYNLLREQGENTKKYQTAMLFKNYRLLGGTALSLEMVEFVETNKKLESAQQMKQIKRFGNNTSGRSILEILK